MKDAFAFLILFAVKTKIAPLSPLLKDAIAFYEAYYTPLFFVCQPLFQKKLKNFFAPLDKQSYAAYNTVQ